MTLCTTLACDHTETRVLGALFLETWAYEICADLESTDFHNPRYRAAFDAIRNLDANESQFDVLSVVDAIAMRDLEHGSHVADTVHAAFLGALLCDYVLYRDPILLHEDLRWLRTLAQRRASL